MPALKEILHGSIDHLSYLDHLFLFENIKKEIVNIINNKLPKKKDITINL